MELLRQLIDLFLHLDRHLIAVLADYHVWIYAILFVVIFAETGLVVTPFLPGDSLLFAAGALAAIDTTGTLRLSWLLLLLIAAAFLGNTSNYLLGRQIGAHAFSGRYRFFKREYLLRTEAFFERHGGMAVVLSRFAPILRTFAPFVAGIGRMHWGRYSAYNIAGAVSWVTIMTVAGYLFGNLPPVRNNFGVVTLAIILISVAPMLWVLWRDRAAIAGGASRG
jgi:membrane-associated protein